MITGTVLSIERCSLHDGPGLRTTVFLKGCPLACLWCHNPESQSYRPVLFYYKERCSSCGLCNKSCNNHTFINNNKHINRKDCTACGKCVQSCHKAALEIKGQVMSSKDIIEVVIKDTAFYDHSGGGLTLSGGEPLAQYALTHELVKMARDKKIHTCIETSGHVPTDRLLSVLPYVDLFLYDFKESNTTLHKQFTGVPNDLIIKNLHEICDAGAKVILRCPIIPGYNDRDDHFMAIATAANTHNNIQEINIMPYHPMGASKSTRFDSDYPLPDIDFPTQERVNDWITKIKKNTKINVKKG